MISFGEKQRLRLREAINRSDAAYTAASIAPLQAPSTSAVEGAFFPNQRNLLLTSSVETLSAITKDIEGLDSRLRRIEWLLGNSHQSANSKYLLHPSKVTAMNNTAVNDRVLHNCTINGSSNIEGRYFFRDEVSFVKSVVSEVLEPVRETLRHQENLILDIVSTLNYAIEAGAIRGVDNCKSVKIDKKEVKQNKPSIEMKESDFEEQLARRLRRLRELARETRKEMLDANVITTSSSDPLTTPTTASTRETKTTTTVTISSDPLATESDTAYPNSTMYGLRAFRKLLDVSSSEGYSGTTGDLYPRDNQSSLLLDQVHDILKKGGVNSQIERSVHFSNESVEREPSVIFPDSGLVTANTSVYEQTGRNTFVTLVGSTDNTSRSVNATRYPNVTLISES
eukprot:Tbor_TRINITY_DN2546_c0_g1::TRINITY_DN2546_c0_g1_i1::g.446::m.446